MNEAYPGSRSHHLPDAVVLWNEAPAASVIESEMLGSIAAQRATGRSGNHTSDGFCLVLGGQSPEADPHHIAELAPLIEQELTQSSGQ